MGLRCPTERGWSVVNVGQRSACRTGRQVASSIKQFKEDGNPPTTTIILILVYSSILINFEFSWVKLFSICWTPVKWK